MLHEDPDRVVKSITFFLPGLLAVGILVQVTDIELNQFFFVFLSIVFSLVIYSIDWIIWSVFEFLSRRLGEKPFSDDLDAAPTGYPAPMLKGVANKVVVFGVPSSICRLFSVVLLTFVTAVAASHATEREFALRLYQAVAPESTNQISSFSPFRLVLERARAMSDNHEEKEGIPVHMRFLELVDKRPPWTAASAHCPQGKPCVCAGNDQDGCRISRYKLIVRIATSPDQAIEGAPQLYRRSRENSAFELLLSPACYVSTKPNVTTIGPPLFRPIDGPGALVFEKDVRIIELVDSCSSRCYRWHYPKEDQYCREIELQRRQHN